ncbi:hypothetical protein HMI54_013177, partial [Coelomomyces lativittatus]
MQSNLSSLFFFNTRRNTLSTYYSSSSSNYAKQPCLLLKREFRTKKELFPTYLKMDVDKV